MNWKCLLVGLTLVFPGTLLSVEGRYFNEESRAVDNQDSFLNNLFNIFEQRHQPARYSTYRDEPLLEAQKKLTSEVAPNQADNNNVQQFEEPPPPAEKSDSPPLPPPAKEESAGAQTRERGGGQGEINAAVQKPQALAQRQGLQASGRDGGSGESMPAHTIFIMVVAGCTVLAAVGIVGAGVCWYKYHRSAKAASVVDYPAYGVTGPTKDRVPSPGDRKLAHSAQMYHYQHQKQQMMALQSASSGEMKHDGSDDESVEDNDDADYTVYECPGLAPTGEMEVKNPLFRGDDTPSTPANDDARSPPEY